MCYTLKVGLIGLHSSRWGYIAPAAPKGQALCIGVAKMRVLLVPVAAIGMLAAVENGTVKAGDFACDLALPLATNEAVLAAKIQQLDIANEQAGTALKTYKNAVKSLDASANDANQAAARKARINANAAIQVSQMLLSERNDCYQIVDLLKAQKF